MTVLPYTVMRQPGSCGAAFQNDNRHRGKTAAFSFHAGQSIVWIRNPGDCFAWLSALHGQGVSAVRHCPADGQRGLPQKQPVHQFSGGVPAAVLAMSSGLMSRTASCRPAFRRAAAITPSSSLSPVRTLSMVSASTLAKKSPVMCTSLMSPCRVSRCISRVPPAKCPLRIMLQAGFLPNLASQE